MELYSAIRKDEILHFNITWVKLQGYMLSEISQREKDNYPMDLIQICSIKKQNKNSMETNPCTLTTELRLPSRHEERD